MAMTNEEYQDHMDKLAMKISRVMEGQRVEDGIIACSACIGFGLMQLPSDKRDQMRTHVIGVIDGILNRETEPLPDGVEANMGKINLIMHQLEAGLITREVCRQRLMEECSVADHNLDMLLNAYDKQANN
jgi:hypothetical protein